MDIKLKVFKKDDIKKIQPVHNPIMGDSDFNQFMRLRSQLVNAAESFARKENLTLVLIPTIPKYLDEQLKHAHKVVEKVDRANRRICVTLLRYNMDKPESSYA